MNQYKSLLEAIDGLREEGYTEDFNLECDGVACHIKGLKMNNEEFEIDKSFRFDNDTDPADQSVIYAISSSRYQIKGILINSYGIYSDDITDEMVAKLK